MGHRAARSREAVTIPDRPPEPLWHFLVASSRLLVGAMLAVLGLLWALFAWQAAEADVAFDGAPVADARVEAIERRATGGRGGSAVYARYRFETPNGKTFVGEDSIPSSEHAEIERTGRARVAYLPDDPSRNRLYFDWMTMETSARANRVEAAIVLVLLGTAALLIASGRRRALAQFRAARQTQGRR